MVHFSLFQYILIQLLPFPIPLCKVYDLYNIMITPILPQQHTKLKGLFLPVDSYNKKKNTVDPACGLQPHLNALSDFGSYYQIIMSPAGQPPI